MENLLKTNMLRKYKYHYIFSAIFDVKQKKKKSARNVILGTIEREKLLTLRGVNYNKN